MVERTLISFPSQLQLIERLQHLLYLSSSMVFISGEKGSGKSTLIEQLSNQLPDKTQQAFISLSEPTSVAYIRQQIVSQLFEQPLFDADDSLGNILLLLKEKKATDSARVVVIDNAHLLPEILLAELAEVIKQKSFLSNHEINFVLLSNQSSNTQMVSTLKSSANINDVAVLTFKLPPLTPDESKQLLSHRFEQLSYSPQVQHQDALLKQLLLCQGMPEKILSLASELNDGELDNKKTSWLITRLPAILVMLLFVAIASALAFYLYPQFIKNKVEVETVIETEDVLLEEIQGLNIVTEASSDAIATEVLAGQWSTGAKSIIDNHLSVGKADSKQRVTISEVKIVKVTPLTLQQAYSDTDINIPPSSVMVIASEIINTSSSLDTKTPDPMNVEGPITPVIPSIEAIESSSSDDEFTDQMVSESVVVEEKSVPDVVQQKTEIEKTPAVEIVESTPPSERDYFTSTAALLAVDSNTYTLQLSGMSTERSLQNFIKIHSLPRKNVYLYKTVRNQKPWYVVIYGQFESRQVASRVADKLPNTLNNLDSWVKKYSSVHQDLQLNEQ